MPTWLGVLDLFPSVLKNTKSPSRKFDFFIVLQLSVSIPAELLLKLLPYTVL